MNTPQFLISIYNWLMADPAHLVAAASLIAAVTPTPNPATPAGKAYKLLEMLAGNVLHAKDSGVTMQQAIQQIAAAESKEPK